jgi:hypothetical protein
VEQFALLLGVSPSSVFRYENAGPRLSHQGPASGKLALLAAWLGDARSAEALGTLLDDRARPKTDGLAVLAGLLEAGNVLRQKSARDGAPPGPPPEAEELARLALGALGPLGRPAPPAPPGRPGPADATASDRAPGNPARLEFEARIMEAEARMLEARARKLEARARLDSVRESLAG